MRSIKKLLILMAFNLLINSFFISQNNPSCFLFEVSQLNLKNSNKGPIKTIPEGLNCFKPFKKQLNALLNIRRNQFYYVDSILRENKLPKSFGFLLWFYLVITPPTLQIFPLREFGP